MLTPSILEIFNRNAVKDFKKLFIFLKYSVIFKKDT